MRKFKVHPPDFICREIDSAARPSDGNLVTTSAAIRSGSAWRVSVFTQV